MCRFYVGGTPPLWLVLKGSPKKPIILADSWFVDTHFLRVTMNGHSSHGARKHGLSWTLSVGLASLLALPKTA